MAHDARFECLKVIFGAHYAHQFAPAGFQELLKAADDPANRLMRDMSPPQRDRLRAVLRLCQLYYREQNWEPTTIESTADVVRLIRPRTRDQAERIVWLLILDASDGLQHEVLVQVGGPATTPPLVNTIIRHALFKSAVSIYIADFQVVDDVVLTEDDHTWFDSLDAACKLIGVELTDCVVMTPNVVVTFRPAQGRPTTDESEASRQLPDIERRAA